MNCIGILSDDAQSQLNGAQANQIPPNPKGKFQLNGKRKPAN